MPISVVTAGARRTASKLSVLSGSLRPVRSARVMFGGVLQRLGSSTPFDATIVGTAAGSGYGRKPSKVTSNSVTMQVNGGVAPYSYAWSIDDTSITIDSATNASTTFSRILFNDEVNATATCIATDAVGSTVSATTPVYLQQQETP